MQPWLGGETLEEIGRRYRDGSSLADTIAVSGGFAIVQPKSRLSINAVEGYPLEDFSAEAVRAQIAEAQKVASGNGTEQEIAEAKIELEVRILLRERSGC